MRSRRSGWPDRSASEQLLDGATRPAVAGSEPLAGLLAAAAAPPRPAELAGEQAALAHFRAAQAERARRAARRRRRVTAGAAAWVAGVAVAATAGVAVAAGFDRPADTSRAGAPPAAGHPATALADPAGAGAPGRTGLDDPSATPGGPGGDRGESTERGLCTAYLDKGATERGRALETAPYRRLVTAAGGPARVEEYCRRMLAATPNGAEKSPRPGQERNPSRGADAPESPATGRTR